MKSLSAIVIAVLVSHAMVFAQGKFSGLLFGDYFYNVSHDSATVPGSAVGAGGKAYQAFQIRRIYFAYDDPLSESFTTRFRLEGDQTTITSGKMGMWVKDAFLQWKGVFKGSDLIFGIQPTPAFDISEGAWGYRALEKTTMDLHGIVPSRDLAIALRGKIDEEGMFNYWAMVGNNSGNAPETDKYKRYYLNLQFKPTANFMGTLYGDFKAQSAINDPKSTSTPKATLSHDATTLALFLMYMEKDKYSVGLEGFQQSTTNGFVNKSGTLTTLSGLGYSVYGTYNFQPDLAVVLRYDSYDPNTNSDAKGDQKGYILAALSWKVDKQVSIMPNIQYETYETPTGHASIDPSLTARLTLYYVLI